MGPPLVIAAGTLTLSWLLVALGLSVFAAVALGFGLLCQLGWIATRAPMAGVALAGCAALSPPSVAFGAGCLDGWHTAGPAAPAPRTATARRDPLTDGPYRAGLALASGPPPVLR